MHLTLLTRQAAAESLGSAGLVTVVVGSGIAASRLPPTTPRPLRAGTARRVHALVSDLDPAAAHLGTQRDTVIERTP